MRSPVPSSRLTKHRFANATCSASIVSILRIALLPTIPDVTYTAADTACWTIAEATSSLMCPCLMTLGPLLKRVKPSLCFSNKSSNPARSGIKSHTKRSGWTDNGTPRSRASQLGHRVWVGGGGGGISETELCRDDDSGPPTTIRERSDTTRHPEDESVENTQAFELGPVSRPPTGHPRDSELGLKPVRQGPAHFVSI